MKQNIIPFIQTQKQKPLFAMQILICLNQSMLRLWKNSYIKLPKRVNYSVEDLINIQNTGKTECLKWCLVVFS